MGLILIVVVYLVIGFCIARAMKDDPRDASTGGERFAWFLAWPVMYVGRFINWVVDTFAD